MKRNLIKQIIKYFINSKKAEEEEKKSLFVDGKLEKFYWNNYIILEWITGIYSLMGLIFSVFAV